MRTFGMTFSVLTIVGIYRLVKSSSEYLRTIVIDKCLQRGKRGDPAHEFLPVTITFIAEIIGVTNKSLEGILSTGWRSQQKTV